MTQINQIYKCNICGNIVEVLHAGNGELVCCGKPMELKMEITGGEAEEKHIPIIRKVDNGVVVAVGELLHPMQTDHYVEWIEVVVNGQSFKKRLNAGDKPEVFFASLPENALIRAYCNIHGLWRK